MWCSVVFKNGFILFVLSILFSIILTIVVIYLCYIVNSMSLHHCSFNFHIYVAAFKFYNSHFFHSVQCFLKRPVCYHLFLWGKLRHLDVDDFSSCWSKTSVRDKSDDSAFKVLWIFKQLSFSCFFVSLSTAYS